MNFWQKMVLWLAFAGIASYSISSIIGGILGMVVALGVVMGVAYLIRNKLRYTPVPEGLKSRTICLTCDTEIKKSPCPYCGSNMTKKEWI